MKHSPHAELRRELGDLDMSQADLAREAEVAVTTVNRWANGRRPIPGLVWSYLRLRRELRDLAAAARKAVSLKG